RYNASKKGLTDTEMDPADNLNESALHQVKPFKVEYHTTDLHKTQTAPWNKQQFNPPPQQPSKEQQQDIMDEKGITGPLIFARSPHAVIDYSNHYSAHASSSSSSTSPPTRQPPWLPPRTVVRPLDLSVPDSNDIELSDNSSSKKSASAGRSAERSPEADDSGSYPRESMISALDYINRRASSLDYINPKASPTTQPQQRVRRNPQCLVYTPSSETDSQPYVAPPTTTSAAVTSIVQPSQRQKQRDSQKQQGEEPVDVILASYGHRTNRRNRRGPRPSAYPSSHSTLLSSSNTATNPASTSTSKSPYVPPASYSSSSSSTLASPSFALLSPPYYPPPVSSYSSPPPPSVSASSSSSSSSATALLPSTKFQSPTTIPRTPSKALSRGRRHVSKRNGMYVQDDEELQMRLERQIAEIKAEHERQYELQQQTLERLRHQLEMLMQRLTTKKI
ncbi:hypothetical protein BC939DRAFT_456269, partial [Gamsiella multidivaricata]|uniref:uncharacterized protein n=1 Tax=Gamsiella multidivaricata TaxID=101098 RepID=UPI00221F197B